MDTMVGTRNPKDLAADFSKDLVNDLPKDLAKDLATSLPTRPRPSRSQTSRSQTSRSQTWGTTRRTAVGLILGAPLLGTCAGSFSSPFNAQAGPSGPAAQPVAVGTGQVKIGLILPLSASGNAGVAAQSMKNAAEMALAEFQNPNVQLLVKDDGGSPQGAQSGAQQAVEEGAEIILGPLFALSVPSVAQVARSRS